MIKEIVESSQRRIEMTGEVLENCQVINFDILRKIIGFILIEILIYLAYRLFVKPNSRVDDSLEYSEEREYM